MEWDDDERSLKGQINYDKIEKKEKTITEIFKEINTEENEQLYNYSKFKDTQEKIERLYTIDKKIIPKTISHAFKNTYKEASEVPMQTEEINSNLMDNIIYKKYDYT
jgi:hypothetical protein